MRLPRLRGFRGKEKTGAVTPGWRGMDYHCHLLPGVDDGMADVETAVAAIEAMQALGYAGAVMTPHIYTGVFDNDAAGLRAAHRVFAAALAERGITFPLSLAAEYYADEHFLKLIDDDELLALPVNGERWVLLEFPYMQETPFAGVCLAALTSRGYRPVVAHVERYRFVAQEPAVWLERFERAGAVLQGDIGSLVGQFGEPVKKFAAWLLEKEKISIWGSDLHHPGQLARHIAPGLAKLGNGRLNTLLDNLEYPEAA